MRRPPMGDKENEIALRLAPHGPDILQPKLSDKEWMSRANALVHSALREPQAYPERSVEVCVTHCGPNDSYGSPRLIAQLRFNTNGRIECNSLTEKETIMISSTSRPLIVKHSHNELTKLALGLSILTVAALPVKGSDSVDPDLFAEQIEASLTGQAVGFTDAITRNGQLAASGGVG